MQVDDKLAKEKLARICEDYAMLNKPIATTEMWYGQPILQICAQAIRNTDLTDCQPQGKWCNYCRKDNHNDSECWSTRPANWKPEGLVNVFGNPIAPAPDQGSVRNATDELDAKRYRWMRDNWAYAHGNIFFDGFRLEPRDTLDDAIDAAIRALPVLEATEHEIRPSSGAPHYDEL